jgi:hypothetical protein
MRHLRVVEIEDLTPETALCCLAWGHLVEKIVIDGAWYSGRRSNGCWDSMEVSELRKVDQMMELVQQEAK